MMLYQASGVPNRHRENGKQLIESNAAWLKTRDFIVQRIGSGFFVVLCGTRGPGKTQIGQQVIAAACGQLLDARYVRAMDVFLAIREAYHKDAPRTELQVAEQFRRPKLLVIDEIQVRSESRWEDQILTDLIDKRYGDRADTLLIANLTTEALKGSLGSSIYDRLREAGGIIECKWPSFRGKAGKANE